MHTKFKLVVTKLLFLFSSLTICVKLSFMKQSMAKGEFVHFRTPVFPEGNSTIFKLQIKLHVKIMKGSPVLFHDTC